MKVSSQRICTNCGECISQCPTHIIKQARAKFPVVDFSSGECLFCEECVDVCKPQALLKNTQKSPWSVKASIDKDVCIAHKGVECRSCYDPKEWHHKGIRKIQASNELLHKALGTINTREKFEAKRLKLAGNVWRAMEATDSRECRNCHNFEFMDFTEQGRRAVKAHDEGISAGKTCIDCHKGIAHELPDMHDVDPGSSIGEM